MKLTLLVSLKNDFDDPAWSLARELVTLAEKIERAGGLPLSLDGVIRAGRDALLFDLTRSHAAYSQVCAYLADQDFRGRWAYFVAEVDESTIIWEGKCGKELLASLAELRDRSGA